MLDCVAQSFSFLSGAPTRHLLIAALLAIPPILVWLYLIFSKQEKHKGFIVAVFFLGCLTAPFFLLLQGAWGCVFSPDSVLSQFNPLKFFSEQFNNTPILIGLQLLLFAAIEEILKMAVIVKIDKKKALINTVGQAMRYSIASALGFSFIENIIYLYVYMDISTTKEIATLFIFRSIFTTCAHIIYSGIFGYYYGLGKYSMVMRKTEEAIGKRKPIIRTLAKIFRLPPSHVYQQEFIITGLFIAIGFHTVNNYILGVNNLVLSVMMVIIGFIYLKYLLNRKTGHLVLTSDITQVTKSKFAANDEEVVLELLAMWFEESKYVDVLHICQRLLKRDPHNKVVQMFQAKAMDKLDNNNVYKKIIGTVLNANQEDQSVISEYIKNKNEESPKNIAPLPTQSPQQPAPRKEYENPIDKYTDGNSFRI
ncbi:hypothetical protein CVV38_03075 [Candidatus Peregrinibacteria bacterium HGW-Peregrinibacteria-1]|jgi:RsiW-degrading membrane proteinase PrsW (M82 family)|nr:MAG: hypothetical protein CVV38_03075 [Candidatus Peregrinibacteria bacterium HGW-Peregrinibacteria-1]